MSPTLHFSDDLFVISAGSSVLVPVNDSEVKTIKLFETNGDCKNVIPDIVKTDKCTGKETDITCASLSSCGKWFAAATGNKSLFLWETTSWTILSVRKLKRTLSNIKFTPSSKAIVVADKTGDAYLYSVQNCNEEGQLLLGHLSMLLDIIVSPCENFILTCDRDEKIRVSKFPNAYNIHAYCLGHEEFVSKIDFFPTDAKVLISGSGDGSIRFWDYTEGKQIGIIYCWNYALNESEKKEESEICKKMSEKQELAVTHFSASQNANGICILAVSLASLQGCILYQISGNSSSIVSSVLNMLKLDAEPWDIKMKNSELWCFMYCENKPVNVYIVNNLSTTCSTIESLDCRTKSLINAINSKWSVFKDVPPPQVAPVMHKRKLDDLQEYKERKQQRLASKSVNTNKVIM